MREIPISLNSIDKVKSFVNAISGFDDNMSLVSGRYVIDPKSIMGIFSLNLTQTLTLQVPSKDYDEVLNAVGVYVA